MAGFLSQKCLLSTSRNWREHCGNFFTRRVIDSDSLEFSDIGIKPGEKLYEELMTGEEIRRSLELSHFLLFCQH